MNTETVLARILPTVEQIIKEVVRQVATADAPPTLYDLEAQTQVALPRIGQAVLQGLAGAQGTGVGGQNEAVRADTPNATRTEPAR